MRNILAANLFASCLPRLIKTLFLSILALWFPVLAIGQEAASAPPSSVPSNPQLNANPNFVPPPTANVNLPPVQQTPSLPPPSQQVDTGPTPEQIQLAKDKAFDAVASNALPMTPEQIQKLRGLFSESQRAASAYPGTPPKAEASSELVNLSPGATPPIVRLGQGYVTSIVFVDSTGAPWPIQAYDVGNPTAFGIQWDKVSNILMVQSTAMYGLGNLAVQLKGLNTPVMVTLVPGQPVVDYRLDMRVQALGPNAVARPSGDQLPAAASSELLNVLDGIAPKTAKTLTIPGSQSQAWLAGNNLFLRTKLTLLSPAWTSEMTSADGMHAYELPQTPSLLVGDDTGQIFSLRVEGY